MSGLSDAEFEKHRAAIIAIKLQKDRTHADEADRHWEVRGRAPLVLRRAALLGAGPAKAT